VCGALWKTHGRPSYCVHPHKLFARPGRIRVLLAAQRGGEAQPSSSQATASPSIRHDATLSERAARAIRGKRPVQSCPLRVKSRTPAASRHTSMRKPSCLISCSHPAPAGGLSVGLGRQGSQKSGKATRRNNMGYKYQRARTSRVGLVHENQDAFRLPRGHLGIGVGTSRFCNGEFERSMVQQRVKLGLMRAVAQGKRLGTSSHHCSITPTSAWISSVVGSRLQKKQVGLGRVSQTLNHTVSLCARFHRLARS
jgi:hypothetical protein